MIMAAPEDLQIRRWRGLPPKRLLRESWDEASLLYHRDSGETHLLGPLADQALLLLQEAPMSLDQLAERLAALCQTEADVCWRQRIETLVAELAALELVEPADP